MVYGPCPATSDCSQVGHQRIRCTWYPDEDVAFGLWVFMMPVRCQLFLWTLGTMLRRLWVQLLTPAVSGHRHDVISDTSGSSPSPRMSHDGVTPGD